MGIYMYIYMYMYISEFAGYRETGNRIRFGGNAMRSCVCVRVNKRDSAGYGFRRALAAVPCSNPFNKS